jgi:hypothetical protein
MEPVLMPVLCIAGLALYVIFVYLLPGKNLK